MQQQETILRQLWHCVLAHEWCRADALRDSVTLSATLLTLLSKGASPRAFRDALLLGKALERIGKGMWSPSVEVRLFLADCVRAVAKRLAVAPFWSEESTIRTPPQPESIIPAKAAINHTRIGPAFHLAPVLPMARYCIMGMVQRQTHPAWRQPRSVIPSGQPPFAGMPFLNVRVTTAESSG